jgi:hypothetical protein
MCVVTCKGQARALLRDIVEVPTISLTDTNTCSSGPRFEKIVPFLFGKGRNRDRQVARVFCAKGEICT